MRNMPDSSERRMAPRTASNRTASRVNSTVLVDVLRASGPMSRSELARRTGLSTATANRLVDRLVDDGVLSETGVAESTGGRPARLVEFNAAARSVLAIDIGGRKVAGAVTDLEAQVLITRERLVSADTRRAAKTFFDALAELAAELVDEASAMKSPVHAVAVGVPGVVRRHSGRVEFAPALQWFDFPLVALLEERLRLPVLIENDVNLVAVAEHRHGAAQGHRDVLTVAIGTGVGAALILDGHLYRGAGGAAGELGYTLLGRASLSSPWPGFGDLDSRVGAAGILSRYSDAIASADPEPHGTEEFLRRVRSGDAQAVAVFDEVVDDLSLAIGNASVLLNPELVVLGGGFGRAAADLLVPAIGRRLKGRIPYEPTLAAARLDQPELIGAAELAIDASAETASLTD